MGKWLDKEKPLEWIKAEQIFTSDIHVKNPETLLYLRRFIEQGNFDAHIVFENHGWEEERYALQEEANQLREESAKLVKALEWYADKSKHAPFSSEMRDDCGQLARNTLSELKGREHQ